MSPTAHSTDLYFIGKGILKFDRFDAAGLPTGLRDMGNAPAFILTPEEETLEHYSSREGVRTLDKEVALTRKLKGSFTLDEYDKENLRLALFGVTGHFAIEPLTAGDIRGEIDFVSKNDVGPQYHVQLWDVKIKPASSVNFISEEWGTVEFELTVQNDAANHPDSPYGKITPLGES
jgi:hypothetical protein